MGSPSAFYHGYSGEGVRVAVLDSGIHASHPHVNGISGGVAFSESGEPSDQYTDRLGHGTAVAAAIREKAPGAHLYAVKVFDRGLSTHVDNLVAAIGWAIEQNLSLINLSLGTARAEHADRLRQSVLLGAERGAIVISARESDGVRWLPGGLPGVIPILLDWGCPRDEYRVEAAGRGEVVFRASGYPRPIPGVSPEHNLKGISFAVANMTGFAARALQAHPGASTAELIAHLATAAGAERV